MSEVVEEKGHAKRSPSSAARHTRCAASAVLECRYPNEVSIHASNGTVMHAVAELCLGDWALGLGEPENAEGYVGRVFEADGRQIEFTMDFADIVNTYCSHVQSLLAPELGDTVMVEVSVPIDHLTGEEGATGTSDVIGIAGSRLLVIDLKTGRGVPVYADNNEQGLAYASGALRAIGEERATKIREVTIVIIQPPCDNYSEHTITIEELRAKEEWFRTKYAACDAAEREVDPVSGMPPLSYFNPGEKQCRFCKVKDAGACPALNGYVLDAVAPRIEDVTFSNLDADDVSQDAADVLQHTVDLSQNAESYGVDCTPSEILAAMFAKVDLIEIWCKAVRGAVETELLAGREVPGYKLVEGKRGNRSWADEAEAEKVLKAARLKADEMYTKKVISFTAAEKLLKKDKPKTWAKIAPLMADQKAGSPSVAPVDDPRPAYSPQTKPEDFGNLDEVDPLS